MVNAGRTVSNTSAPFLKKQKTLVTLRTQSTQQRALLVNDELAKGT